ncbi:hypothetical protein ACH79_33380 [Bradyrhizobium sp. CCBAU 051011]|uniref:hypothetical protein n=1 Tax=Bradyrhizobium sp. CCBAU 051011 TaxID=858422 RepID=UPI0013740CB8|nr:hypothetical protein [Bradyrhizobium sp. CCBAU 051011]QHO76798.1 hypothetical protein ACH79_33380 [Bradyrhizobium sp. CCBAU 051011]
MSENRDEATGQFTPSTEGLFGREYENAKAGFTTRKDEPAEQDAPEGDPVRQAAANRAASQVPELELSVTELRGEIDTKEAVTVEQAAKDYAATRTDLLKFADGLDLATLTDKVDEERAKVIKGDPKIAEQLGVEMSAKEDAKAETAQNVPGNDDAADAIDTMEGLDPETRKALKIPQVRQALEGEFAKAEAVQQSYANALNVANQYAMANLVDHFPELANIPAEQWEPALNLLSQQDPQRFNRAMGVLQRVSQLQSAQAQWQQQQAQVQQQQFQTMRQQYSRASDAALGPMTMAEKAEMVEDLVSYVAEYGLSREQFAREAETNLALHHPAFQRLAADAIKYRRMVAAPKAVPQALPPVQRPGVSQPNRSTTDHSSKIQALQKQLASAKGDKAARIAGQIKSLKRAS